MNIEQINHGSYYTPDDLVLKLNEMVASAFNSPAAIYLDSSCGNGAFLKNLPNWIGCDIDEKAVALATKKFPQAQVFSSNSLANVSREKFNIHDQAPLVIIGNPPFNDKTSQIKGKLKLDIELPIDADLKNNDLGICFLRSYPKLNPKVICVFHPLSYLIKKSNFSKLKNLFVHYQLAESRIFKSALFPNCSKTSPFPICGSLFLKNKNGFSYDALKNFIFTVEDGANFSMNEFAYVNIEKYPKQFSPAKHLSGVYFYPQRDINSLKRNKSFVFDYAANLICIEKNLLKYYVYLDVFKDFIYHTPYYFRNHNVMINYKLFAHYENSFITYAVKKHPALKIYFKDLPLEDDKVIKNDLRLYFKALLGKHFVNS